MNKKRVGIIIVVIGVAGLLLFGIGWHFWKESRPISPVESKMRELIAYTVPPVFTTVCSMPVVVDPLDIEPAQCLVYGTATGSDTLVIVASVGITAFTAQGVPIPPAATTIQQQEVGLLRGFNTADTPAYYPQTAVGADTCDVFSMATSDGVLIGVPFLTRRNQFYCFVEIAAFGEKRRQNATAVLQSLTLIPPKEFDERPTWKVWLDEILRQIF